MENNTVKRDNRKALPKFFLILLGAAVFGGVAGFAAGWMGHDNLSGVVTAAVTGWLTAMAPWAMIVTSAVSLAVILWLYRSAKKLYASWDGEEETAVEQAEEKLSWAMMAAAVQVVLDMFNSVGKTVFLEETYMDAVGAISGSGEREYVGPHRRGGLCPLHRVADGGPAEARGPDPPHEPGKAGQCLRCALQ